MRGNLVATSKLKKHVLSRVDVVFYPITPAKKDGFLIVFFIFSKSTQSFIYQGFRVFLFYLNNIY